MAELEPVTALKIKYGECTDKLDGFCLGGDQDLNEGAGGEYVYLCYSTDPSKGPPITAIQVAASSSKDDCDCIPPGYTKVEGDLNKGAGGKYVYVSYVTGTKAKPVTEITFVTDDSKLIWPRDSDFYRINQDCNEGAGGRYIYMAYK